MATRLRKQSVALASLAVIAFGRASADDLILTLFEGKSAPAEYRTAYFGDGYTLAFMASGQRESMSGTYLIPDGPGDYYIMRVKSLEALASLSGKVPYVMLGEDVILKADVKQAATLSFYGWGLTRLMPQPSSNQQTADWPPFAAAVDSNILEMISSITPESSRQLISELSAIVTRNSYALGCRQAEQYAYDHFSQMGLNTSFFNFQLDGIDMRNVIGELIGVAHPESIIIVCGHLDCTSETPMILAPGAEDNATGSAVVLEAARALSEFPCDLTVRFITFSGEEQGLVGSDYYASYVQSQNENIVAVINADMVGYSGPYSQDMYIFSDQQSHSLGSLAARILSEYSGLDTVTVYDPTPQYGSDHYPFAIRGYPSIFFIDAWFDYDWYPYYHTVADTAGNLNFEQQASIGRVVAALAATLVRPDFRPQYVAGDVNASGDVNGIDVTYLVAYLKGIGEPPPEPILRADANGSCGVNGIDVIYLVTYLKGGPLPFYGDCR